MCVKICSPVLTVGTCVLLVAGCAPRASSSAVVSPGAKGRMSAATVSSSSVQGLGWVEGGLGPLDDEKVAGTTLVGARKSLGRDVQIPSDIRLGAVEKVLLFKEGDAWEIGIKYSGGAVLRVVPGEANLGGMLADAEMASFTDRRAHRQLMVDGSRTYLVQLAGEQIVADGRRHTVPSGVIWNEQGMLYSLLQPPGTDVDAESAIAAARGSRQ